MKKFRYSFEAILIILGIIILFRPSIINTVFDILGIVIVLYNVAKFVLGKLGKTLEYPIPRFVVGVLIGICVATIPNFVGFGIPLVLGFLLLYNGIERLVQAYQIKQLGGQPKTLAIIGGLFSLVGIIVIINPFNTSAFLFRLLGLLLAGMGVIRIVSDVRIRKQNADIIPDVVDAKFHEK